MDERPLGSSYGRAGARWMVDPEAIWRPDADDPAASDRYAVIITEAGGADGRVRMLAADAGFSRMTGYTLDALQGQPRAWLDGPETDGGRLAAAFARLAAGEPDAGASVQYRRDGRPFGAAWAAEPVRTGSDAPTHWIWVLSEIALERVAEEGDAAAPERPALVVVAAHSDFGDDARILEANPAFAELTGHPREELLGGSPAFLEHGASPEAERRRLRRALAGGYPCRVELLNHTRAGRPFWNALDLLPFGGSAERPLYWLGLAADVTARRERQQRTYEAAYYDDLTGLPNRALAQVRMEQAIRAAHRNRGRVGFLYIDLDALHGLGSRFGRVEENYLLQQLATRLADATRASDTLAYIGGDEFLVVAEDLGTPEAAGAIAERLCGVARGPVRVREQDMDIGATIGVSVFPDHGGDSEQLVQRADAALIQARRAGAQWAIYSAARTAARVDPDFVERELPGAIARDEFAVAVQPIVGLAELDTRGHEALGRWHHPDEGWIPPAVFLAGAADKGLLDTIGTHVQQLAFAATASWRSVLRANPPRVCVNLAAGEFVRGAADRLLDRLALAGLAPAALELDLAPAVVAALDAVAVAELERLQGAGVGLALDDCGDAGQLRSARARLALQRAKIDLVVVRDIHLDPNRQERLAEILEAAREHGVAITAEGVETAEEAEYLAAAGCDEAQGYYFGRPEVI